MHSKTKHKQPRVRIALIATAAAAALVGIAATATPADADRRDRRDRHVEYWKLRAQAFEAAYAETSNALDRIERTNQRVRHRANYRIQRIIDQGRSGAASALDPRRGAGYDRGYDTPRGPANPPPRPPNPIARYDYDSLLATVRGAGYDTRKLRIIQRAARQHYFTVGQVVGLLHTLDFENYRVEAAATLHPRVIDPTHWNSVYSVLRRDTSRRELASRCDGHAKPSYWQASL